MGKIGKIFFKILLSAILFYAAIFIYFVGGIIVFTMLDKDFIDNPGEELLAEAEEAFGVEFPEDLHISRIENINEDWQSHHYDVFGIYSNYTEEEWVKLLGDKPTGAESEWSYSCETVKSFGKENYDTCLEIRSTCMTDLYEVFMNEVNSKEGKVNRQVSETVRLVCEIVILVFLVLVPWLPWKEIIVKIRRPR